MRDGAEAEKRFRILDRVHNSANNQPVVVGPGVYARALATAKLNAIGMFNDSGGELVFCLAPALVMVNHSCLPNCQQLTKSGSCSLVALRDIDAGEELSYSYIMSLGERNKERKESILRNWNFSCICGRCSQKQDCQAFDSEHTCYCGSICLEVDRSSGTCICNPART